MNRKTLNNTYLSMFCTELAMLLDAGLTISDSLQVMLDDEASGEAIDVVKSVYDLLMNGKQFAAALKEAEVFPRYMVQMIEVGEKTGRLVQTLTALSEYYDRQSRMAAVIKNSILYPATLLVLMIAVVVVLIVQVLPMFSDIYSRLGVQMDPLSITLMRFGSWLSGASIGIAIVVSAIIVLFLIIWIVPTLRKKMRNAFMNLWGSRGIFGRIASSRFVFAMTLSMASGLDTSEAVNLAASLSGGSKSVDAKNKKCIDLLDSGKTLAESMHTAGVISQRDSKMLSVGSVSGKADLAMAEIARRCDADVQIGIDRIVGRVEPTLVIISSAIVGIILLSVMLPLMGIMTAIG